MRSSFTEGVFVRAFSLDDHTRVWSFLEKMADRRTPEVSSLALRRCSMLPGTSPSKRTTRSQIQRRTFQKSHVSRRYEGRIPPAQTKYLLHRGQPLFRATRQLPMLEFYRNTTRSGEIEGGEGVTVRGTPKQRQVDRRTGLFLSVFGRLRCDSCA